MARGTYIETERCQTAVIALGLQDFQAKTLSRKEKNVGNPRRKNGLRYLSVSASPRDAAADHCSTFSLCWWGCRIWRGDAFHVRITKDHVVVPALPGRKAEIRESGTFPDSEQLSRSDYARIQ